jgi:hypothetical protein
VQNARVRDTLAGSVAEGGVSMVLGIAAIVALGLLLRG